MAQRMAFYTNNSNKVCAHIFDFEWVPGLSNSQKKKSMHNLHSAIGKPALEVSTKSDDVLGIKLSAFNLRLGGIPIENVFQSSKCFDNGGPYKDLLEVSPKEAKTDERLRNGRLTGFDYNGKKWDLSTKTAFYDFIYSKAVKESIQESEIKEILKYDYFTDIEFNHNKSLNTQARTVAIIKAMLQIFDEIPELNSEEEFLKFHKIFVLK